MKLRRLWVPKGCALLSVFVLALLMVVPGAIVAQDGGGGEAVTATITKPGAAFLANGVDPILYIFSGGNTVTISNGTGAILTLDEIQTPAGSPVPAKINPDPQPLAIGGSKVITFTCPQDVTGAAPGNWWIFDAGDGPGGSSDATIQVQVNCPVPALSNWGILIFALLLLPLGWFIHRRSRRRSTSIA